VYSRVFMKPRTLIAVLTVTALSIFPSTSAQASTLQILSGTYIADGFYVGPLTGNLDSTPITFYCEDFNHQVFFGQSWSVTENTFATIPQTRWHDLRTYENIAFLLQQLTSDINNVGGGDVGAIQEAIWRQASSDPSLITVNSTYWFDLAASQDFTNTNFSNFIILTPTDPNNFQEMIDVVPEPSTMALAILGLGLATMAVRRRA
jgi:PEP-CTERM motif